MARLGVSFSDSLWVLMSSIAGNIVMSLEGRSFMFPRYLGSGVHFGSMWVFPLTSLVSSSKFPQFLLSSGTYYFTLERGSVLSSLPWLARGLTVGSSSGEWSSVYLLFGALVPFRLESTASPSLLSSLSAGLVVIRFFEASLVVFVLVLSSFSDSLRRPVSAGSMSRCLTRGVHPCVYTSGFLWTLP